MYPLYASYRYILLSAYMLKRQNSWSYRYRVNTCAIRIFSQTLRSAPRPRIRFILLIFHAGALLFVSFTLIPCFIAVSDHETRCSFIKISKPKAEALQLIISRYNPRHFSGSIAYDIDCHFAKSKSLDRLFMFFFTNTFFRKLLFSLKGFLIELLNMYQSLFRMITHFKIQIQRSL